MKPSEQRGGTTPDEAETREKGVWAEVADEGIVPEELGGFTRHASSSPKTRSSAARCSAARPARMSPRPRPAST